MQFDLRQGPEKQHRQSCKFYGIDRKKNTTLQTRFPVVFGRFLGSFNHACIEYAIGAGSPKFSLRVVNIVPWGESPVLRDVMRTWIMLDPRTNREEAYFEELKNVERAMLSLYRDGKSSPWDVTEQGYTHGIVGDPSSSRLPEQTFNAKLTLFLSAASPGILLRQSHSLLQSTPYQASCADSPIDCRSWRSNSGRPGPSVS